MAVKAKTRKIFIAGVEWTVKFQIQPLLVEEAPVYGYTDPNKLEIAIAQKGLNHIQIQRTVIHEICHAIIDTMTVHHPDDEERCVAGLETGIWSIIKDPRNAWLWEFLQG
jgi:hypothetical protein